MTSEHFTDLLKIYVTLMTFWLSSTQHYSFLTPCVHDRDVGHGSTLGTMSLTCVKGKENICHKNRSLVRQAQHKFPLSDGGYNISCDTYFHV